MDVLIPYEPRPLQKDIHGSLKRWNVIVCHRRFGKTVLAVNELIRQAVECDKERPRLAYLAPTYKQAKSIAWDYLKHYSRPIPGIKVNESELRIDYPWGARIQLFGCDNPDALRGIYLDGVVLDEYAQMPSGLFGEVIRPALSDREGWALFIGTPKGHNAFHTLYTQACKDPGWFTAIYRASETGIVPTPELEDARKIMTEDEYEQEYECSWSAAIQGAIYGKQIAEAEKEGRVRHIQVDPILEVETFWDLGRNDTTAIWFMQKIGQEARFIDYHENRLVGLDHYIKVLKDRGYNYGKHYLPHDVEITELTSNRSRRDMLEGGGIKPITVVPRISAINEGLEMTRRAFRYCWFHDGDDERGQRVGKGLEALRNYQYVWDDKYNVFRATPLHNWASNGADAFRQFGQGYKHSISVSPQVSERRRDAIRKNTNAARSWVV